MLQQVWTRMKTNHTVECLEVTRKVPANSAKKLDRGCSWCLARHCAAGQGSLKAVDTLEKLRHHAECCATCWGGYRTWKGVIRVMITMRKDSVRYITVG